MKLTLTVLSTVFACLITQAQESDAPHPQFPGAEAPGQAPAPDAPPADATAAKPAPPVKVEDAIPQAFREDRYQTTLAKNPFLLKTGKAPVQTESFAKDWDLKFMRETKGVIKAGIQNRVTQEYRNIGPEADAEGFRIVKAKIGRNRKESSIEVEKGTEVATLTYGETAPPPGAAQRTGGMINGQQQQQQRSGGMIQQGKPGTTNTQNQGPTATMPQGYRPQPAVPQTGNQMPNIPGGGRNMNQLPTAMPANPGAVQPQGAPANPVNRRRVLIPTPAPGPSTPQ